MSVIPLTGSRREGLGKGGARKARAAGLIPGVLYGHGEQPIAVAVGARDFQLAMAQNKGGNPIVNLNVGGRDFTALIRSVQYDPITHGVIHLDFQHISLTERIEVEVPVRLTGLPVGVKDAGGILEQILRTVEVRCLPTAIPSAIEVEVSHLGIGDSVHVSDLKAEGLEVLTEAGATVATVVPPTVIEEKPAEEVAAAAEAEPELSVERGKKEEEGEETKEAKETKEAAAPKEAKGKETKERK
ncbi:MAG TPA: 50S ribosomal protein L25 [Candidatus Eisenbacteria bacterium]